MIVEQLINAILMAGIYAVIAIGFSLIYGVMNIINLTHGSFIVIGAYTSYYLWDTFGLDPFISVPISFAVSFILGYLLQRYVINRIVKSGILIAIVLTFGLSFIFLNGNILLWGSQYKSVFPAYSGLGLDIGGIVIQWTRLGTLIGSILMTLGLYLFMEKTKTGHAIKATALNKDSALLVGINIYKIYAITFGLASGLGAVGGSLMVSIYPISPFIDAYFLSKAFIVAVMGGLGNMWGAIIGGLILAFAETFGVMTLGPSYQSLLGLVIFLVVIITKPNGLVGKKFYAEI